MCLGIPMRVVKIEGSEGIVETRGLKRKANMSLLANIKVGEYVILHAGFAIEKLKAKEARKTLEILRDI